MSEPISYQDALKVVRQHLKDDQGLYIGWQANIAIAFQDTLSWAGYTFPDLHRLSNSAACLFLNNLLKD